MHLNCLLINNIQNKTQQSNFVKKIKNLPLFLFYNSSL